MADPSPIFVFDAYGTLFDVHSAMREYADALGENAQRCSDIWRAKQLEYTWIYAAVGCGIDRPAPSFAELTRVSLAYALAATGCDARLAPDLVAASKRFAPFAEVADNLNALRASGARLAILSNADPETLQSLVAHAGIEAQFEHLLSVRPTGTYKPAPAVYRLATDAFGCTPGAIRFVSSNRWDCAGAKAFGFSTAWINRTSAPPEYDAFAPDRVLQTLSADALRQ